MSHVSKGNSHIWRFPFRHRATPVIIQLLDGHCPCNKPANLGYPHDWIWKSAFCGNPSKFFHRFFFPRLWPTNDQLMILVDPPENAMVKPLELPNHHGPQPEIIGEIFRSCSLGLLANFIQLMIIRATPPWLEKYEEQPQIYPNLVSGGLDLFFGIQLNNVFLFLLAVLKVFHKSSGDEKPATSRDLGDTKTVSCAWNVVPKRSKANRRPELWHTTWDLFFYKLRHGRFRQF